MNFANTLKLGSFIVFTSLTLISCNYIFENKKDRIEKINEKITRININKKEAKLLLEASKNNIDILELCERIKDFEPENNIKNLIENFEKKHFEILNNYNDLATEKLISIPSYSNFNSGIEMTETDSTVFIKSGLEKILGRINKQIITLDTLAKTTNNVDFKVLTIKNNYILKSNINKIKTTLKELI